MSHSNLESGNQLWDEMYGDTKHDVRVGFDEVMLLWLFFAADLINKLLQK